MLMSAFLSPVLLAYLVPARFLARNITGMSELDGQRQLSRHFSFPEAGIVSFRWREKLKKITRPRSAAAGDWWTSPATAMWLWVIEPDSTLELRAYRNTLSQESCWCVTSHHGLSTSLLARLLEHNPAAGRKS